MLVHRLASLEFNKNYTLGRRLLHSIRTYKEDKRWPGWEVIVGIEVHAQIKSRRKLFSGSLTSSDVSGTPPNTHVSPFDAAFPGTLPKLNPKCVDLAIRTALALESEVQLRSSFDRKHYFYADLPAGYQITQSYAPIAKGGVLKIHNDIPVRIHQIQLEQDTAKSTFNPRRLISNLDLNRAGTGLMEIVSEPDMRSPEDAASYVRTLQSVLRSVGSSDGNMEQGSLRCDVNVSVNRPGEPPGTRCEVKNLNSMKFIMMAIISEVRRQTALLQSVPPIPVTQETRGFDEERAETYKLRSKEDAPDYRYMPDPNLPPLILTKEHINSIRDVLPELPPITRARLKTQYGLSPQNIDALMSVDSGREIKFDGEDGSVESGIVWYFEQLCSGKDRGEGIERNPKVVVNWITQQLLGQLSVRKESFRDNPLSIAQMGEIIDLVDNRVMTGTSGKILLRHLLEAQSSDLVPSQIAEDLQLISISSASSSSLTSISPASEPDEMLDLCKEAIKALPQEAAAVRDGNDNVLNKIVGRVMKESRGRADAMAVKETVKKLIFEDGGGEP